MIHQYYLRKKKIFPFNKLVAILEEQKINNFEISQKLSKYLPTYMIPEEFKFIKKFKLNQNGKIDRKFYE